MERREFLKRCALAAGSTAALGSTTFAGGLQLANATAKLRLGAKRYNVLFILVDQWRYSAMSHGFHHDKTVRTPNLDKLSKEGAHWQWCYSAQPVCTPNRSALITGKLPHQIPTENDPTLVMDHNDRLMNQNERCIANVFTDAGYHCHYIGKWHINGGGKGYPAGYVQPGWRRHGFTTFEGFNRGHNYWYYNSYMITDDGQDMKTLQLYPNNTYEPTFQTDLAINFMKRNNKHPFFCYLSWGPPHTPYNDHPAEFTYNPAEIEVRPNVPADQVGAAQNSLNDYYAHCTAMDVEVGRLMDFLKQEGLADNTLVVFTADHGDMHRSHNMTYKSKPEEESCHVPLLMRLPDCVKPGQVITNSVNSIDLMPTILSLCGMNVPDTCTGTDKSPLLKGQSLPEESIFSEYQSAWRMVVKKQFKLIVRNVDGVAAYTELFDLNNDPYEMTNLLDNPAYTSIQNELKAEYAAWQHRTGDVFPG